MITTTSTPRQSDRNMRSPGVNRSTRLHLLTRYDTMGASSRVRFFQFVPLLRRQLQGIDLVTNCLLSDNYLDRKYSRRPAWLEVLRGYASRLRHLLATRLDICWIEKELWPWAPAWFELLFLRHRPYAIDLDDAIFHNYDQHRSRMVQLLMGGKIDRLMRQATHVLAGNAYLAERARRAGARSVKLLPTVIDLTRYRPKLPAPGCDAVRIVWIGSPATVGYLSLVLPVLADLASERDVELWTIGANAEAPGLRTISVPWSEATEAEAIAACDIGIMPLHDSCWERGKCGYKLIQYMGCGLPVVASPIGVNREIVTEGETGFLAPDAAAWKVKLQMLIDDPELRLRLGRAGRLRVEQRYSIEAVLPDIADALQSLVRS
jgi:glycosyltransferase involved in cell wall biosynthesis